MEPKNSLVTAVYLLVRQASTRWIEGTLKRLCKERIHMLIDDALFLCEFVNFFEWFSYLVAGTGLRNAS